MEAPAPGQPLPLGTHVIQAGKWRITVRVESVEWVGDEPANPAPREARPRRSEITLSTREVASFLRRRVWGGRGGMLARSFDSMLDEGEYRELRAFREGDKWRVPLSAFQRYLKVLHVQISRSDWKAFRETWRNPRTRF